LYVVKKDTTETDVYNDFTHLVNVFSDLGDVMSKLTEDVKKDTCVAHALELQGAWALKNYSKFFKLHANAPKMAGYLIDWFAHRERKHALKTILKA